VLKAWPEEGSARSIGKHGRKARRFAGAWLLMAGHCSVSPNACVVQANPIEFDRFLS
jgi:hypothetical protein